VPGALRRKPYQREVGRIPHINMAKLAGRWRPVTAIEPVRARALRLVRTHALGAADALQLAAALVACGERPEALPFVCLDDRLRDAARREGFPVLP